MKKILSTLLAISGLTFITVACSSGGSSANTAPQAPAATAITPPAGFDVAPGSASGVATNAESGQIAVPTSTGYSTLQLSGSTTDAGSPYYALYQATQSGTPVTFTNSGSNVMMSITDTDSGATTLYAIATAATQGTSKALNTVETTAESYSYTVTPTSNLFTATLLTEQALVFGAGSYVDIIFPNGSSIESQTVAVNSTVTAIDGSIANGVAYLAAGTASGNVWVINSSNLTKTDLSTQAPSNKYTPGNVNSFGFPSSLNQGNTLVGYWNVGTIGESVNIYRITGTYVNNTPTGNGFLNTTLAGQQTTTNGTTVVTFTGFPANNNINSSYVDSAGNVWVGSKNGKVYVLRTGATQWTQASLGTGVVANPVTVGYNGAASGATAVVFNGSTYSVN